MMDSSERGIIAGLLASARAHSTLDAYGHYQRAEREPAPLERSFHLLAAITSYLKEGGLTRSMAHGAFLSLLQLIEELAQDEPKSIELGRIGIDLLLIVERPFTYPRIPSWLGYGEVFAALRPLTPPDPDELSLLHRLVLGVEPLSLLDDFERLARLAGTVGFPALALQTPARNSCFWDGSTRELANSDYFAELMNIRREELDTSQKKKNQTWTSFLSTIFWPQPKYGVVILLGPLHVSPYIDQLRNLFLHLFPSSQAR